MLDYKYSLEICKSAVQIQIAVVNRLRDMGDRDETILRAREELEGRVLDTQEVYESYAKRFEMWDIAIDILSTIIKDSASPPKPEQISELSENYTLLLQKTYMLSPKDWPQSAVVELSNLAKKYYYYLSQFPAEEPPVKGDALLSANRKRHASNKHCALFPVETIVKQAEVINLRHFDVLEEHMPDADQSTEVFLSRPECWVLSFLRSEVVKYR